MPRYIFTGRVLPERAVVEITAPKMRIEIPDAKLGFNITISVHASQIAVIVESESDLSDIATVRNSVDSSVRLLIDAFGYLECRGYDVEISSVIEPDGKHTVFGVEVDVLKSSRVGKNPVGLPELWTLLLAGEDSGPLQNALGNLREAIKSPDGTGMYCLRAVESMRQHFVKDGDGDETKASWDRMSAALKLDESFVSTLKPFATAQRHGESPHMSGVQRIEAMKCSWQVVDRYVEYSQRGFGVHRCLSGLVK